MLTTPIPPPKSLLQAAHSVGDIVAFPPSPVEVMSGEMLATGYIQPLPPSIVIAIHF